MKESIQEQPVKGSALRLRLLYFLSFMLMMASACSTRDAIRDESEAGPEDVEAEPYDGRLLAQVVFDSVDYIVPTTELMQPFIREFGDGTVVDKVMIRKVQETKDDAPLTT
ncbi:hypothetical protein GCM10028895_47440 [Pontibacter rugosus]